jgi:hypothetical protein
MTEIDRCACGNPGSVDARDGDTEVRCVPCRKDLHRQRTTRVPEPHHVEHRVVVGRQSGDPFDVATSSRRLLGQIDAARELVLKVQRLLPSGLDALDVLTVDGYPSSTPGASQDVAASSMPVRPCRSSGCANELPCPDHGDPCPEPGCRCARPCHLHDSPVKLTTVEAAALTGGKGAGLQRQLDTSIRSIAMQARRALDVLEQLTAPTVPKQLCSCGTGREGVIEWGDPTCRRVPTPTKAGMCDECWAAEDAWRAAHELPARERTTPVAEPPKCVRCGTRSATRADGLCDADRMKDSRARRRSA